MNAPKSKPRNSYVKVMYKRYQHTTRKMRDRRLRRNKDAKNNSWRKEWE